MKKALNIFLKLLLTLIILTLIILTPILGVTGIFPAPTPDLYNTQEAAMLMAGKYIMFLEAIVFALAVVCLWSKRVALAYRLLLLNAY